VIESEASDHLPLLCKVKEQAGFIEYKKQEENSAAEDSILQ
jgi:hypothetical protein